MPPRCEYLGDVLQSADEFNIGKTLIINPGNPEFSPWISKMASMFESYKFHKLKLKYIPRCSTNYAGFVALSPDCNPRDAPPSNSIQMFQNEKTVSNAPWAPLELVFNHEMLNKRSTYFCRPLAANADKDLYDVGNIFVVTGGKSVSVPSNCGQLWLEYEVEFFTPESSPVVAPQTFLAGGNNTNGVTSTNPVPNNIAQQTQIGEFVSSVTTDGTQSLVNFAKDFHGLLTMTAGGTGITLPAVLTNVAGMSLNQVEGTWNGNSTVVSGGGTNSMLANLITATAGSVLGVKMPAGVTNTVAFALEKCSV